MEITDNTFNVVHLPSFKVFNTIYFFLKSDVGPDLKPLVFGYAAGFNSRVSLREFIGNSINFHLHKPVNKPMSL